MLHDDSRPFDARTILEAADRERVNMISIVGDAYARPLIDELRRAPYDLSASRRIGTGGAITSPRRKQAMLELLPDVDDHRRLRRVGDRRHGLGRRPRRTATRQALRAGRRRGCCRPTARRFLDPGDDEIGWIARRGRVPLGYLDDGAATEATFPVVDGERVAVPGDRARFAPDGRSGCSAATRWS